jgi:hypothetical protein
MLLSLAAHLALAGYHVHFYRGLCNAESSQLDCNLPVFDPAHSWDYSRLDLYGGYPWDTCNGYFGTSRRCPAHEEADM